MTIFEKRFLNCRPDPEASTPASLDGLAFSPGPLANPEPLFSDDVRWIEEYPEEEIVDTLASIDGVCCLRDGRDSPWAYRWSRGDRSIDIVQSTDDVYDQDGEAIWLGSRLRTSCTFADLVWLWNALRARLPAVWLFNKLGRMFTPQSFLEECALPALCRAVADGDPAPRDLANESFVEYAALAGTTRQNDTEWRRAAAHMSVSAFSLRWPLVELTGLVPRQRLLERTVRQLDHALRKAKVQYYAYPAMCSGSRRGITVWVSGSGADVADSIMRRVGLIEPSLLAGARGLMIRSGVRGRLRPDSQVRE